MDRAIASRHAVALPTEPLPTISNRKVRDGVAGMNSREEDDVLEQLDAQFAAAVEDLLECLRQPSISKTGEGLTEMAHWLSRYLERLGATVNLVPGEKAPIVEAFLKGQDDAKTLLFYELYDVQPATESGWIGSPFEPRTIEAGNGDRHIVARGAFNSKGPLMAFLVVLNAFRRAGHRPPVNIRFLIEGEEEIGSPSLEPYVLANLGTLRECDAAYIPYLGTDRTGTTAVRLGFKGLVLLELKVEGGAWGGPAQHDVHAMHCAWLASPAWELVYALASLRNRQGDLTFLSAANDLPSTTPEESQMVEALADTFDRDSMLKDLGAERFVEGSAQQLLRHWMFDPTLNIHGLSLGQASSTREPATVLPHQASAHIDLRIVPGMDVESSVGAMRQHLRNNGFAHVRISTSTAYGPSKMEPGEPVVKSLVAACRKHTDRIAIYPLHAGAAPLSLMSDVVGIPYAFGGVGYGGRSHSANEFISVEGFRKLQRTITSFLFDFGES